MLFSSPEFIFVFLPATWLVYFTLAKRNLSYGKSWLLLASLIFYAYWNPANVFIIVFSTIGNFIIGKRLLRKPTKILLVIGVSINLLVLGYYKYSDFFLSNINDLTGSSFQLLHIILPLGISFFTFQQVAFLVDSYEGKVPDFIFSDYCLFVTFFPQLIAGPIVHHSEMMPQFNDTRNGSINYLNISKGLFIFNMGLAKKIIIADTLAVVVNRGYSNSAFLSTIESWITSLFYSFQLYFDFSGYSDMAVGLALMFNIHIPINFNSPYRASNIQEFWRRWHITLSRFLREYVYIPMGGNKGGELKKQRNLMLTFLIGGLWHGAGWTFIVWGALHGAALSFYSSISKYKWATPSWLSIVITFLFVNVTWVFFRANSWSVAIELLTKMFSISPSSVGFSLITDYYNLPIWLIAIGLLFGNNSNEISAKFELSWSFLIKIVFLVVVNSIFLNSSMSQEFLYFDF
jgi:alginate O-acetyltransferase complex protein AlgI